MPEGQVLEFDRVTKRFNTVTAVSELSVRVEPGAVTGFLGPNGAGKTTSLRMLLGQIRPTSGTATIGGSAYSELRNPLRTVGAVLEEAAYRPRRTATRQLTIAAKANGIPLSRVDEVLRLVGLQDDADTRLGSYSLGMRQRLAVGSALLGDPGVLVLDEPANGLDPEGIRWMRLLMRRLADEGRTVLVSSHVLSEIEQVADNVVVLSKGHSVFSGPIETLEDPRGAAVVVDADSRAHLITALSAAKLNFDVLRSGVTVRNSDAKTVGAIAAEARVPLTLLQQRGPSLEDVFLDLVYGRAGGPQLSEVANPVAHAPQSEDASGGAAAASAATSAAAAVAGGAVAAAGAAVPVGGVPISGETDAADEAPADADAGAAGEADAVLAGAEIHSDDAQGSDDATRTEVDEAAAAADTDSAHAASSEAPSEASSGTAAEDAEDAEDVDSVATDLGSAEVAADEDDAPAADAASDDAHSPEYDAPTASDPRNAAAALWAPRPAAEPAPEHRAAPDAQAETPDADTVPSQADGAEQADDTPEDHDAAERNDATPDAHSENDGSEASAPLDDEPERVILPQATTAVSIPQIVDTLTFSELITGIPAAVSADDAEQAAPATEAIPVFSPLPSDDDDDLAVDDAEDDPRLAAMRTSLSSAASRFFDGPAPDYPYGDAPAADEQPVPEGDQHEN